MREYIQIIYNSKIQTISSHHMQKPKQKDQKQQSKWQGAHLVAEVFSLSRDVQTLNPYHMDGDIEMYSEQSLKKRESLRQDAQIIKEISQIIKIYHFEKEQGRADQVGEAQYKKIQKILALILRPNIDEEELDFVVEQDWCYDRLNGEKGEHFVTKEKLSDAMFDLVDVWTIGASKEEYISFCKLMRKKIERSLKIVK